MQRLWVVAQKVVPVAHENGRLRELFITKFKSQFKWGFAKVVVARAGRLQEWTQGEPRLYDPTTTLRGSLSTVVQHKTKLLTSQSQWLQTKSQTNQNSK